MKTKTASVTGTGSTRDAGEMKHPASLRVQDHATGRDGLLMECRLWLSLLRSVFRRDHGKRAWKFLRRRDVGIRILRCTVSFSGVRTFEGDQLRSTRDGYDTCDA